MEQCFLRLLQTKFLLIFFIFNICICIFSLKKFIWFYSKLNNVMRAKFLCVFSVVKLIFSKKSSK